jgi:hypothetical protein
LAPKKPIQMFSFIQDKMLTIGEDFKNHVNVSIRKDVTRIESRSLPLMLHLIVVSSIRHFLSFSRYCHTAKKLPYILPATRMYGIVYIAFLDVSYPNSP